LIQQEKQQLFKNTTSSTAVLINCNDKIVLKNEVQFLASQQYRQSKYVACNLNPFCNGPFAANGHMIQNGELAYALRWHGTAKKGISTSRA